MKTHGQTTLSPPCPQAQRFCPFRALQAAFPGLFSFLSGRVLVGLRPLAKTVPRHFQPLLPSPSHQGHWAVALLPPWGAPPNTSFLPFFLPLSPSLGIYLKSFVMVSFLVLLTTTVCNFTFINSVLWSNPKIRTLLSPLGILWSHSVMLR